MQRYHAPSCASAVTNSAIGGASARDTARADTSSLLPNFLLNSRVVQENVDVSFNLTWLKRDEELVSSVVSAEMSGDGLFDSLLLVLHGLLSSCLPRWLRSKAAKDFSGFDREAVESLQNELDSMQLPDMIRWRIQAAIPILFPSFCNLISCHPPSVPIVARSLLQPSFYFPGSSPQRQARTANNTLRKSKSMLLLQEYVMEIDPWTLLEDGAALCPSSSSTAVIGSSDHANL